MKVRLEKYDNSWFYPGSLLKRISWIFISIIFFRTNVPIPSKIKAFILRLMGARIGIGVVIKPNVNIKYPWNLSIGDNTWIGEDVWIDNLVSVNIGGDCCLSQGCYLLTGNHDFTKSTFDLIVSEINIENEAWVGAKAVVCPGVTVGRAAVLTVGSVATKNMDELGIYQGNPAKKIKERVLL
ncbi:WcaF family extracellular polysaccharide biosynthesis acetyltransferase [Aeromonas sanarellii]|uniref:WcaF family extracellular polysaccharide biosynthesis acetyltransferase n=1 Tax=Aeromonas sanarellii TaxID=633415 RepID=A0ABS4BBU7_9GAMM|nr:WcaF family extracellular polysaccharide biosynthesis acetyltransferase [Aeromonas sanarellii]MBP0604387.1 WcaF family extracellular polysaccharide biosynthesis acetyltransferase [Aeromonas sanarellii]